MMAILQLANPSMIVRQPVVSTGPSSSTNRCAGAT
jgi:hypothetical protein